MKVYKRKHHRGQRHYSGKELIEQRKAEREEKERRYLERIKESEEDFGLPVRYYPASILCGCKFPVI